MSLGASLLLGGSDQQLGVDSQQTGTARRRGVDVSVATQRNRLIEIEKRKREEERRVRRLQLLQGSLLLFDRNPTGGSRTLLTGRPESAVAASILSRKST